MVTTVTSKPIALPPKTEIYLLGPWATDIEPSLLKKMTKAVNSFLTKRPVYFVNIVRIFRKCLRGCAKRNTTDNSPSNVLQK